MSRHGILFDLDGTLADTAPDLVAVLNLLLAEHGQRPVPYAIARNVVSHGAVGLIRLGFGLAADESVDTGLREQFLDFYTALGHVNSSLFIELNDISNVCTKVSATWGIVTNKPEAFTRPLLAVLGIDGAPDVVVSGDTLAERKPHPAPLEHAAARLGLDPTACIYIGDAERDIIAGRAAGMRTIATTYGYIRPAEDPATWRADAIVDHPRKIPSMLLEMTGAG